MFEGLRAARKYGQAARSISAGDRERYFQLLLEVYALITRRSVKKTSGTILGLAGQALKDLVIEADRRGDEVLAKEVLLRSQEIWKAHEAESPQLRQSPPIKQWIEWLEK